MASQLTDSLVLPAPAKLNLFLHITGRRADGYHLLQTLFLFLDHADQIRFTLRHDGRICRSAGNESVPEADDLVVKAARLLQEETAGRKGVSLEVIKKLPMGGGLGGGSSDAATVLLGLNHLWGSGLGLDELAGLGLRLGADVPVFVRGRAAWAEGVGEVLEAVDLPEKWYVVIHPNVQVPTAKLFAYEGLTRSCEPIRMATFLTGQTTNVFEPVVKKLYPEVAKAFEWLSDCSPARLTGSGACLFAEFNGKPEADNVLRDLPVEWSGFVAKGCCVSPLHKALRIDV